MENQRGRSRKRKVSPAKKAMNILKRTVVAVLCFAMVAEYVPSSLTFAAEGEPVIESEGYTDEVTLDDLTEGTYEGDTGSGEETGTGTNNEADAESDSNEEGGSEEGAGEVTGDDEDEGTPDSEETPDSEDDDEEDAESDDEEDEESEEDAEPENEADDEYTDADDEEDAEGEDEDEEAEDEEIVEEEEAAAGAGAAVVPSTSYVTSYKTVSATIYTDDTYEEKLSDGATIELSGKMPKGAEVKAFPVEVEIEDITVLAAYDITIFDEDGEEYEPEEDDVIEVTIENDEILEALEEERELTVFHMEDEDDEPEEIAKLPPKTKKPKFSARHFSIYIVGEEGLEDLQRNPHYVYTVNFYYEEKNESYLISTQILSPGEKLEQPSVPDIEHKVFAGWYTEQDGTGDYLDPTTTSFPEGITENTEIDYYAHYEDAYYVHYMTHAYMDDDSKVTFHSEKYGKDDTLDTSTAESLYLTEGYLSKVEEEDDGSTKTYILSAVTGWVDQDGKSYKTGDMIDWDNIDGDLELYPVVEDAYWLYFDLNGDFTAEVPEPQYVIASDDDDTIGEDSLPTPEVSGYSFAGWYTAADANEGTQVSGKTTIGELKNLLSADGSVTLYAHWDTAKVAYTVNIWRQKATVGASGINNKVVQEGETYDEYIEYYDYAESITVSAEESTLSTGDVPETNVLAEYSDYGTLTATGGDYYGFEYNQDRTENDLKNISGMKADGSTIINIFYDRVTITWTFTDYGVLMGLYGTDTDQTSDPISDSDSGINYLSKWPELSNGRRWQFQDSSGSGQSEAPPESEVAYEPIFIILNNGTEGTDVTFSETTFTRAATANFYLEVTNDAQLSGSLETRSIGGTKYVYDRTADIRNNFPAVEESKYSGYTYYGYGYMTTTNDDDGNEIEVETFVSSQTPGGGFIDVSELGAAEYFIYNNADTYTITLLSDNDKVVGVDENGKAVSTTEKSTYSVKYGEALKATEETETDPYPFPTDVDAKTFGPESYYSFTGWYKDPSMTAEFTRPDTMPAYNLVAYAGWTEREDITITFRTGASDVEIPSDWTNPIENFKAGDTLTDPGTLEREGYTHVGWIDQNGSVFNFETKIYDDLELTAIWKADDESGYIMSYVLNTDNSYGLFDGYDGDEANTNYNHFTTDEEVLTIEEAFPNLENAGYEEAYSKFIAWNTKANGSGTMFYPDDDFVFDETVSSYVNADGEHVVILYAIWAHENESTLILYINNPDGTSETKEITGSNLNTIDLVEESGLSSKTDKVTTSDGKKYYFAGWSTSEPGENPTESDVNVGPDDKVAVDTLYEGDATENSLYTVWVEVIDITVTKEWDDGDDADGIRPSNVTVSLQADGSSKISQTLSKDNDWTYKWEDQPVYNDDGNEIKYSVGETTVADKTGNTNTYKEEVTGSATEGFTVTNSYTPKTINIKVTKEWDDADNQDGIRPESVSVTLLADEQESNTAKLNEGNQWTYTWENLPANADGQEIKYTVEESTVADKNGDTGSYSSDVAGNVESGFTITNTHTPETIDVSGTKTWDDANNQDGKRPTEITVNLIANGSAALNNNGEQITATVTDDGVGNWNYSFTNLPKYADGQEIEYSVTEEAIDDYSTSYSDSGYDITNSYTPSQTSVTVTKSWQDDEDHDGIRPNSVTVQLYIGEGNDAVPVEGKTLTLNDDNHWTDSFTELDEYESGKKITYTVQETDVPGGYTAAYTGDATTGFTITNTHEDYIVSELTITKVWNDKDDQDGIRPESITVELQIDGKTATDIDGNSWTAELTKDDEDADGNWTITVYDHPVYYLSNGSQISYVLHEDDVKEGYEATEGTVEINTDSDIYKGTVTITNTHTPEQVNGSGEISVTKTWDDVDNKDELRPSSVTIQLLADGVKIDEAALELSESNNWSGSFTGLDKYRDEGTKIVYTVSEESVDGYEVEITGDVETGFVITNTHDVASWSVTKDLSNAGSGDNGAFKAGDTAEFMITVTNTGNTTLEDIVVTEELEGAAFTEGSGYTLNNDKTVATIGSLDIGESIDLSSKYEIKETDIGTSLVNSITTGNTDDPTSGPEASTETIPTETPNTDIDRDFFDIDEEIVPDEGDSSTWEKDEEVEEKHAIEFEMTTTLPSLTEDDLKGLVEDGFTLVFHNDLDNELKLDSEENTDLHITIGGKTIGSEYYSVDINQSKDEWSISTLSAQTAIDDGCAFHVTVDLSKLYEAELISADDFAGDTQITVFFYADLEGAVEDQKYVSTVWYEVYDGEEAIYESNKDSVTVHVTSTTNSGTGSDFTPSKSVDKGEGITVYYGDSLTYTITYKNTSDEAATVTITDTLNNGLTFSSASDGGEYDSSSRTVTWTLENVEAGYEGSVTLTATVNSIGRTNGNITNTAYVQVGDDEAVEVSNAVTNPVYKSTSSGSSGSSGSGSSGSTTTISHVRNVNNGKTGHWILEGGYLTLPDGSHPSNEYLDVDGEIWAFYTYGYAVAKRHTQYYTDEAISAVGYIPRVTGTWETIGWWFEYDDGTYPHDEWALLEYNGLTYWYHFDVDGWMDDGWFTENGNTYYLDPVYDGWRGHMMTGWQLIGGYWYYFSEDPNTLGVMLKDTTTPDGYYVDANGRWVE